MLVLYVHSVFGSFRFSIFFFFSSRRRHTRYWRDWSSDVCSSDLSDRSGILSYCGAVSRRITASRAFSPERARAERFVARSEERRVGKECRSRWSPDHEKKKESRGVELRRCAATGEYDRPRQRHRP